MRPLHLAIIPCPLHLEQIQFQFCMSLVIVCRGLWFHENLVAFVPGAHRDFGEEVRGQPHSGVAQPYRRCDRRYRKQGRNQEYDCNASQE